MRQEAECHRFVEGVLWISWSGARWRLLPREYANWNSIYKRFARWCEAGVWERLDSLLTKPIAIAAQQALGVVFGAALHEAFGAQGLSIGGTTPKFEVGRFEINANFIARAASISYGKEVVVKRVPLSVEAILKAYQSVAKSITGRAENPETWIAQFNSAWNTAREKKDRANPRVNIVDCYFELVLLRQSKTFLSAPSKNSFADYTRAQFAYDLQEIAVRPHRVYKGQIVIIHPAIRTQADSSTKSSWVVDGNGPHDGRYIGDIVIDKDE